MVEQQRHERRIVYVAAAMGVLVLLISGLSGVAVTRSLALAKRVKATCEQTRQTRRDTNVNRHIFQSFLQDSGTLAIRGTDIVIGQRWLREAAHVTYLPDIDCGTGKELDQEARR